MTIELFKTNREVTGKTYSGKDVDPFKKFYPEGNFLEKLFEDQNTGAAMGFFRKNGKCYIEYSQGDVAKFPSCEEAEKTFETMRGDLV